MGRDIAEARGLESAEISTQCLTIRSLSSEQLCSQNPNIGPHTLCSPIMDVLGVKLTRRKGCFLGTSHPHSEGCAPFQSTYSCQRPAPAALRIPEQAATTPRSGFLVHIRQCGLKCHTSLNIPRSFVPQSYANQGRLDST